MPRTAILFVCLGNICRSPTAEGVFRQRLSDRGLDGRFTVDSAGTGDWHVGHPPDRRARFAAANRGFDISSLRARQVRSDDMETFDYLIAMDHGNHRELVRMAGQGLAHKVRLFMEFAGIDGPDEVPDPYYGDDHGFDRAIDLIEAASDGLIDYLLREA
ncbi:MAG: low molecular weight phosphotyrosine protein phosphatase [Gammaproteobacteria bacterium]|nr:low molecular weight phosphotyrosine protein phosphatase [Gammaproteobacteria bacterium]MXY66024.1 low molecular weight phosphotyrosine protein phosphatase [Gammaproteobacteria bacterium]MYG65981.1 low molecular weight phosphotyrosine protein phosphatase [Gammaproteobacteria bacterium]